MIQRTNIIDRLVKEQTDYEQQQSLLGQAAALLKKESHTEDKIRLRLQSSPQPPADEPEYSRLNNELMFSEDAVKCVCTKYRLRFLDADLFAGTVPREAVQKIKKIEQSAGVHFKRFKIMAPASRFQLKDAMDDPVLMADLGNGRYYMIHKWGNDMPPLRSRLYFPLRNITALAVTAVAFGALTVMLLPGELFPAAARESVHLTALTKIYSAFILSSFFFVGSLIFGILAAKEFSEDVWNSKFFN